MVLQLELEQIILKSLSLTEVLNDKALEKTLQQDFDALTADKRLTRWCQVVAKGDWDLFQKRLQWDGLDFQTLRPILGTESHVSYQHLPKWADTLRELIDTASEFVTFKDKIQNKALSHPHQVLKFPIDSERPLPFEDVLLPGVKVARKKLLIQLDINGGLFSTDNWLLQLFSEEAYLTLERNLLERLVSLCEKTLGLEFFEFRSFGCNLLSHILGQPQEKFDKTYYDNFVQKLLSDGLLTFFQKYSVLGRLVAISIDFWVEAVAEFLKRLKTNLNKIEETFVSEKNLKEQSTTHSSNVFKKVVAVKPFISDFHNKGRAVIIVEFDSGMKVVYKPKDLSLDVAYYHFLEWCNKQKISLTFKLLKTLNYQNYGWVEYVEHLPCEDSKAVENFYKRAGMILCIAHVFNGIDFHSENLIASREHPVLIDLETIMQPQAKFMDKTITQQSVIESEFWLNSVIRTSMLPDFQFDEVRNIAYDYSGLGKYISNNHLQVPLWEAVNTDGMRLVSKPMASDSISDTQYNIPRLQGQQVPADNYIESLVAGFKEMYRFFIEQRQTLLASDSPLDSLNSLKTRFIFRPTQVYASILQGSLQPKFLQNGIDRTIEFDILSRAFLGTQKKPDAWSILHAELTSIEQLDIPFFETYSDSDAITIGPNQLIDCFLKTPCYQEVLTRLQRLNETNFKNQVAIIQGAFHANATEISNTKQFKRHEMEVLIREELISPSTISSQTLLEESKHLARDIQERAIKLADGRMNWLGFEILSETKRLKLTPLNQSLYDGKSGIALFLSAIDYVTGKSQYRNTALDALLSLRQFLQESSSESAKKAIYLGGLGGATGLGSIIYSLIKVSQFLKDTSLLEDAKKAANLITPELIADDKSLDIISGNSGAILGLLTLYHQTKDLTALDKAVLCGQHLLANRLSLSGSPRGWKVTWAEEKPLTGFSHGAAGIALALLRLYAVTQETAYLEAALEGIAYEQSVFSESAGNWADFRENTNFPSFSSMGWCNGAPGIGLARLGSLSIIETKEIRQDIEVALQTTQKLKGISETDKLCCGNLGICEFLLVGSQKLKRPLLAEFAHKIASEAITRAKLRGRYLLFPDLSRPTIVPGFFTGTSGIGYQTLRLAFPNILPSVLLWE